jgi:uncharacterized protein (TIGR00369 family)
MKKVSEDREIPNYWQGNCFVCSRNNTQGLQLRFWLSEKGCFTKCTIPEHLCGFDGLVHGGIVATLLDEIGAWTIISHLGRFGITREISIRYLKPVLTKTEIIVEGEIISHDERDAVLHATIHSADGTLLAEGESKWIFPKLSTIASITEIDESMLQQFLARYSPKEEGAEKLSIGSANIVEDYKKYT